MIAVGIRTPASAKETPRAVVCSAWADQASADAYAAAVPAPLADGTSVVNQVKYSSELASPQVSNRSGDAHVVGWVANKTGHTPTIFLMLNDGDLPGLTTR